MSKKYRFKGGKHYAFIKGEHRPLEVGEIVEMTDKVAYGVRDRFELVEGSAPEPEPEPDPLAIDYARIVDGNIERSRARIKRLVSDADLDGVETAEKADRARAGVLKAIASRRAELSE